jgi:hypothetical protein
LEIGHLPDQVKFTQVTGHLLCSTCPCGYLLCLCTVYKLLMSLGNWHEAYTQRHGSAHLPTYNLAKVPYLLACTDTQKHSTCARSRGHMASPPSPWRWAPLRTWFRDEVHNTCGGITLYFVLRSTIRPLWAQIHVPPGSRAHGRFGDARYPQRIKQQLSQGHSLSLSLMLASP